jgi:hypothetical protein
MIASICNGGLGAHRLHAILLSKRHMPVRHAWPSSSTIGLMREKRADERERDQLNEIGASHGMHHACGGSSRTTRMAVR